MGIKAVSEPTGQYEIFSGFSKRELRRLVSNKTVKHIQFSNPLSQREINRLEKIVFSERPDISLRVYGFYSSKCDLTFLEQIPSLKRLSIDCLHNATGIEVVTKLKDLEMLGIGIFNLDNFDFLSEVNPNLKELLLHSTKSKKPKIDVISRFKGLEYLYLEGQQKGIESISSLEHLKEIVLRSISTSNLEFLKNKSELWSVDIKLGGIKNFDALKSLPSLKYLELWQIRGLSDLSFISNLESLQHLFIQSLKQVTEVPDTSGLKNLRRIYLENLKGLENLETLEFTPNLDEFIYVLAQNQQPQNLLPILKNKSVKKVLCRFGSDKKNNEFDQLADDYGKIEYKWSKFEYI